MKLPVFLCGLGLPVLLSVSGCGAGAKPRHESEAASRQSAANTDVEADDEGTPIHAEVTAFVLTKCPYAAETIRNLVALRREMGNRINVNIGYVGLVDSEGNIDPGMAEAERRTAAIQVCVSANSTAPEWFDYLGCVYEGDSWRLLPTGWETCVEKSGISVDDVGKCIETGGGDTILAQAYGAAMASRISGSPTVIINGLLYVQDRSIASLRQYVCHVAGRPETRPPACEGVPEPPAIEATLLYDTRCAGLVVCDVEGEIALLEQVIPGLRVSRVRFMTDEGRGLFDRVLAADIGVERLPLVVVEDKARAVSVLKELLGEQLRPFEGGYLFTLGGGFDPLAEICDNGDDDNGDGKTDCEDPTCEKRLHCRESLPRRLDLFAMSQCPFALDMMPAVDRLLSHFSRDREKIDFNLQFIGGVTEEDTLTSMHGESEVAENLRMICAQSLYRKQYKFMEYVLCRAEDVRSPAWERCVPKGMSKKKIRACAEGEEGRALLKESFALAENLKVTGSPTWILNNKGAMSGRQTDEMLREYCAENTLDECDVALTPVSEQGGTQSPQMCR